MKSMEMFVLEIGNQECLPWLTIITPRKQKNTGKIHMLKENYKKND